MRKICVWKWDLLNKSLERGRCAVCTLIDNAAYRWKCENGWYSWKNLHDICHFLNEIQSCTSVINIIWVYKQVKFFRITRYFIQIVSPYRSLVPTVFLYLINIVHS